VSQDIPASPRLFKIEDPYLSAVRDAFGDSASHGVIVKTYSVTHLVKEAQGENFHAEMQPVGKLPAIGCKPLIASNQSVPLFRVQSYCIGDAVRPPTLLILTLGLTAFGRSCPNSLPRVPESGRAALARPCRYKFVRDEIQPRQEPA
jgi:hypothetical protein